LQEKKFLKDNFEVLSTGETFGAKLDSLEEQLTFVTHTSRSSLSARFLSRAQQQHLQNVAAAANAHLQVSQGMVLEHLSQLSQPVGHLVSNTVFILHSNSWVP
jgi:hypothetical protein